jgi:hypothetical protein
VEDGIPTGTVGTSMGPSAVVFGEECRIFDFGFTPSMKRAILEGTSG